MINYNTILNITKDYTIMSVEDGNFIIPNTSESILAEKLFTIDELGKFILESINGTNNVKTIINTVYEHYNADKECIEKDVIDFLEDLYKNGIII